APNRCRYGSTVSVWRSRFRAREAASERWPSRPRASPRRMRDEVCAPTLAASSANSAAALPPEGEQFAPWGGPAALMGRTQRRLHADRAHHRADAARTDRFVDVWLALDGRAQLGRR